MKVYDIVRLYGNIYSIVADMCVDTNAFEIMSRLETLTRSKMLIMVKRSSETLVYQQTDEQIIAQTRRYYYRSLTAMEHDNRHASVIQSVLIVVFSQLTNKILLY